MADNADTPPPSVPPTPVPSVPVTTEVPGGLVHPVVGYLVCIIVLAIFGLAIGLICFRHYRRRKGDMVKLPLDEENSPLNFEAEETKKSEPEEIKTVVFKRNGHSDKKLEKTEEEVPMLSPFDEGESLTDSMEVELTKYTKIADDLPLIDENEEISRSNEKLPSPEAPTNTQPIPQTISENPASEPNANAVPNLTTKIDSEMHLPPPPPSIIIHLPPEEATKKLEENPPEKEEVKEAPKSPITEENIEDVTVDLAKPPTDPTSHPASPPSPPTSPPVSDVTAPPLDPGAPATADQVFEMLDEPIAEDTPQYDGQNDEESPATEQEKPVECEDGTGEEKVLPHVTPTPPSTPHANPETAAPSYPPPAPPTEDTSETEPKTETPESIQVNDNDTDKDKNSENTEQIKETSQDNNESESNVKPDGNTNNNNHSLSGVNDCVVDFRL